MVIPLVLWLESLPSEIVLAIATNLNWKVKQLDVNNAFLNGIVHESVYVWQPRGFEDPKFPNHVCKLRKALYGLRQAPIAWFESLRKTLIRWGFFSTKADTSLFVRQTKNTILIIIIYVDDILVTSSSATELQKFTDKLHQMFSLKDLGEVHYFLGLEITIDETLYVSNPEEVYSRYPGKVRNEQLLCMRFSNGRL